METVRVDVEGPVTTVRLNRPASRNALNGTLIAELTEAFRTLPASTRVAVLAGEGPAFCAGADIEWMKRGASLTPEENDRDAATVSSMLLAVDECPVPVISRVHGVVLGGGIGLVAASDIVVADASSQFGFPEVRLGIVPAVISAFVLPILGARQARRYFLTGERFPAPEARALGLVHETVPAAALEARVSELAGFLSQGGPRAVRAAKRMIREVSRLPRERALEVAVRTLAELRVTPEAQEGLSAFLEKRKPLWP
jgi:methylglutaconyl-CoA hydratase